ncbi:MAG: hypothetical protein COA43_00555 [Robiginitomaculum sp.]|nr:MAG: hypothetical protein COA43_00555 [Robiginitomaculum sp.]
MSTPITIDIEQDLDPFKRGGFVLSTSDQRKLIEEYLLLNGLPIFGLEFDFVWKTPGSKVGYFIFQGNSIKPVGL